MTRRALAHYAGGMENTPSFPHDPGIVPALGDAWPHPDTPDVAVVIGAGAEGLRAARTLAVLGLKVSVFDRDAVPGRTTSQLRRKLLQSPNVRIVGGVDVLGILGSPHGGPVRGIRARLRGLHDAEFFAHLVVDATGAASTFDCWRGCPGYARAVDVDVLTEPAGDLALAR
jgi:glycine/D-amino acid oxidase-like deaminating enzyme